MVEIGATVLKYWPLYGARSGAHVLKTIPIPLVLKLNTFIVPSINIELISPTMKCCRLSSFSISLSRSHLPGHLLVTLYDAPVIFFHLSFDFHRTLFLRAQKLA